jgi:hypothetical protein
MSPQSDKNVSRETLLSDWGPKPYKPTYFFRLKRVGLRGKSVVLAIGGQWIAALRAAAKAAVLGVTAAGA